MKQAVIQTGGKQYLVKEGEELDIEVLQEQKNLSFSPLLIIDKDDVLIGTPTLADKKVTAEVLEPRFKLDKVLAIRYKAKKRVKKVRGHRQHQTKIKITKIS